MTDMLWQQQITASQRLLLTDLVLVLMKTRN